MSKCLKCGASLPPVGDCPACAAAPQPALPSVPSLLDKEIRIDRRSPERAAGPAPVPPGMVPQRAPAPPPGVAPVAQRPAAQPPAPQAQAAAAPRPRLA